ncbi:MAG: hypothetical protein HAW61_06280, partial [Candidatus Portiera sp.]|nr:hypothetical protein [Portiera sp.]
ALGIACQTLPAIIGITYCSFFTRSGINLGMLGGIITVILSDPFFFSQFNLQLPAMEYLLNVKSVLWGLAVNFVITIALSFITNDVDSIRHKKEFHNFLSGYAGLPRDKRHLKLPSWIACILWLIFALSPTVFVSVYDFNLLGGGSVLSLILGWQILWGLLGISLLWYLAKNVELAYYPYKSERVALRDSLLKKE